jgi:hypothetical protein
VQAAADNVGDPRATRTYNIVRSSHFAENDFTGSIFASIFPETMPFGRGHLGEKNRRTRMTKRQWAIRMLNNSDGRMAQNPTFIAYMFDQLSLEAALSVINVSVKFHPERNAAIAAVTECF